VPSLDHSSGAPEVAELQSIGKKPLVSLEGWARFEAKARNRRIERRLEAARAAIQTRRFADARAAVDELREIDPSLPALTELAAQLALADQQSVQPRVIGPYVAAAATFAALTLAASWAGRDDARLLPLLQSTAVGGTTATAPAAEASLPSHLADVLIEVPTNDAAAATSGEVGKPAVRTPVVAANATRPPETVPVVPRATEPSRPAPPASVRAADAAVPAPLVPVRAEAPPPAPPNVPRELQPPPGAIVERAWEPPPFPPSRPPVETAAASPAPASSLNASAAPPAAGRAGAGSATAVEVDESSLVRDVLRRYQTAYDRLDAGLAHAVWPAVNEAALARAFGDLESQSITFNNCDVRLRADTAAAVCTGSARYTPKVGSREPRVEPRVWNFTLRKRAGGWLIETARAER
jgi:hypothetical protein